MSFQGKVTVGSKSERHWPSRLPRREGQRTGEELRGIFGRSIKDKTGTRVNLNGGNPHRMAFHRIFLRGHIHVVIWTQSPVLRSLDYHPPLSPLQTSPETLLPDSYIRSQSDISQISPNIRLNGNTSMPRWTWNVMVDAHCRKRINWTWSFCPHVFTALVCHSMGTTHLHTVELLGVLVLRFNRIQLRIVHPISAVTTQVCAWEHIQHAITVQKGHNCEA